MVKFAYQLVTGDIILSEDDDKEYAYRVIDLYSDMDELVFDTFDYDIEEETQVAFAPFDIVKIA